MGLFNFKTAPGERRSKGINWKPGSGTKKEPQPPKKKRVSEKKKSVKKNAGVKIHKSTSRWKKRETKATSQKSQKNVLKKVAVKKTKSEVSSKGHKGSLNISSIKAEIEAAFKGKKKLETRKSGRQKEDYMFTGIEGFDALLDNGIPKGSAVIVAGGAGSGKTIFTLQTLMTHVKNGEKCLYMSFEESEERLVKHMEDFGWNPKKYIKKGKLLVKRFNPFEITRSVDALLMKAKGELLIDAKPIIFPKGFKPDIIAVDSLTAIASAFTGKEDSYRIYIEQLFRFFEEIKATSFLITETKQVPTMFSTTGVEEFLADAVVVIYNITRGNVRERAIEILKLRGAGHQHKIVAMSISSDGLEVFPDQEVFGGIGED